MKKRIFTLFIALALAISLALHAGADFGDFGGGTDYDFDWGGGYDTDWGGNTDWGTDYDTDWDDNDNDDGWFIVGNTTDDDDSSGGSLLDSIVGLFCCALPTAAVILLVLYLVKKKGKTTVRARSRDEVIATDPSTLMPVSSYLNFDPAFNETSFCDKMSNLYVQMQNGWTAHDISSLRPYFTDELFTRLERQLAQKTQQGLTNYVENIAVLESRLLGFRRDDKEDHAILRLRTRIVDYTVNDKTGEVVTGSKTQEKFMTYEWELTRTTGQTTLENDGLTKISCPSCGAPLDINVSARCEYCDSVINLESHNWAIASIKGISQRTV